MAGEQSRRTDGLSHFELVTGIREDEIEGVVIPFRSADTIGAEPIQGVGQFETPEAAQKALDPSVADQAEWFVPPDYHLDGETE